MKLIPLSKGQFAQVDDVDYDELIKYKWSCAKTNNGTLYAARSKYLGGGRENKKSTLIFMHRFIMGTYGRNILIDHIDHDGLNNQRSNLRECTQSQNLSNRRNGFGTSTYIGVCLHKKTGLFKASVSINKKPFSLGYFKDEIDAAKARDASAKIHYGEFANLNFK